MKYYSLKEIGFASIAALALSVLMLFLLFTTSASAATASQRTWVASTGSDSNPCTRSKPCATFQKALLETAAGGEVDAEDSADYGPIEITFPVTIDGGGSIARIGSVKSQSACSAAYTAVCITAGNASGQQVILRNLSINVIWTGPSFGVDISASNAVLENVKVSGPDTGIAAGGLGSVSLRNVTLTSCGMGIESWNTVFTVEDSLITNVGTGIFVSENVVYISNSTVWYCYLAPFQVSNSGAIASFGNNRFFGVPPSTTIPVQ